MNEILKLLNALSADELESVILRANIILEKKRKEETEQALEKERLRQAQIEQEKQRQQEIAELERKLQELKSRPVAEAPDVKGDGFVMYDTPKAAPAPAPKPAAAPAAPAQTAARITCPHCKGMNTADSVFCSSCGQRLTAAPAAAKPASQAAAPARPAAAPQPQKTAGQVRFMDPSAKLWDAVPGEETIRKSHEILLLQPEKSGKYCYCMEVTNKRILITRQHAAARGTSTAFGFLGGVITEMAGGGFKPWAEIPLTAIRSCGLRDKKEFVIEADVVFVMKNKKYDEFLPELVNRAKNSI